ncbi:unnamed protein product [Cochlearia groenlandica]
MMRNVNNSIYTVNAAASAIVSAETRVQPSPHQKKRYWTRYCFLYSCFGSRKRNKRIGHEPYEPVTSSRPITMSQVHVSSTPHSSPTSSFLDPSSSSSYYYYYATQTPPPPYGLYSRNEHPSAFVIGPYAHEAHLLVTPPVFSAFTTEPSTAPFTPPSEPAHATTSSTTTTRPSSPEVPFAELLTSSLEQAHRRNTCGGGVSHKYPPSPGSYICESPRFLGFAL